MCKPNQECLLDGEHVCSGWACLCRGGVSLYRAAKLQDPVASLHVEYLLSEDRQDEGPHSPYNAAEDQQTVRGKTGQGGPVGAEVVCVCVLGGRGVGLCMGMRTRENSFAVGPPTQPQHHCFTTGFGRWSSWRRSMRCGTRAMAALPFQLQRTRSGTGSGADTAGASSFYTFYSTAVTALFCAAVNPSARGWGAPRGRRAVATLRARFPPSSGNLVIHTHATTSFTLAYGLCFGHDHGGSDQTLADFVRRMDPIGPAGVVHLVLDSDGRCTLPVAQPYNLAGEEGCSTGNTNPWMCEFDNYPGARTLLPSVSPMEPWARLR